MGGIITLSEGQGQKTALKSAVEYAAEILEIEAAINEAEDTRQKRECRLAAHKKREELVYYCRRLGLSVKEVFRLARK